MCDIIDGLLGVIACVGGGLFVAITMAMLIFIFDGLAAPYGLRIMWGILFFSQVSAIPGYYYYLNREN